MSVSFRAAVAMERARIRAVLFDLGGTLLDERDFAGWSEWAAVAQVAVSPEDLAHAYAEVEEELDRDPLPEPGPAAAIERWRRILSRAAGREVASIAAERFVASRSAARDPPLALYSDVRRCLDQLRSDRRRLAVVSNSTSEAHVRRLLDRAGILDYFERVVSSGTEGVAKPSPEIFHRAVSRLGLKPEECLYVGNLPQTDAVGAARAGLRSVWLHRDGTGLGAEPPEITSLLEVPLFVRQLESPRADAPAPSVK